MSDMWENKARKELAQVPADYAEVHLLLTEKTIRMLPSEQRKKIEQVLERLCSVIPKNASKEKQVALLYYTVTSIIRYDTEGMNHLRIPFTFAGALCGNKAVCMGIAELFQLLCTRLEIPALTVIGYVRNPASGVDDGGLHAWVMVQLEGKLEGKWYHLDPTWDIHKRKIWTPRWFLLGDDQMASTHYWERGKYPVARDSYSKTITIHQRGVDLLCAHWRALIQEFCRPGREVLPSTRGTV